MTWLRAAEAGMGRRAAWAAVAAVAVGAVAFATGLRGGTAPRTFAALIASWLFFAGIAAGAVAFRALFRIIPADWARPLEPIAGLQAAFAPAAAVVLVAILAGSASAPWIPRPTGWLATPALVAREVLLNAALLGLAYFGFRPRGGRREPPSPALSIGYCLLYAVVLSVWAFDFVLGPDPVWGSTLIGPYLFVAAFVAGVGTVTLLGLARGSLGERERRDAGALVLALAIFWAYLFWSQFLTIWYANLPEEIGFALRRSGDGRAWMVLAVVALVFALPFAGLLHPAGRKSPRIFGAILVGELLGLWLDCHLLVVPSLSPPGTPALGVRDLLIALGMLGAFALSVGPAVAPAAPADGAAA